MLKIDTVIPGLEVPALDALSPEDLDAACDALFVLHTLAQAIRSSQTLRREGRIAEALTLETRVDTIYQRLPQSLRW